MLQVPVQGIAYIVEGWSFVSMVEGGVEDTTFMHHEGEINKYNYKNMKRYISFNSL